MKLRRALCMIGVHFYTDWHFSHEIRHYFRGEKYSTSHVYIGQCDCCGVKKYKRFQ